MTINRRVRKGEVDQAGERFSHLAWNREMTMTTRPSTWVSSLVRGQHCSWPS